MCQGRNNNFMIIPKVQFQLFLGKMYANDFCFLSWYRIYTKFDIFTNYLGRGGYKIVIFPGVLLLLNPALSITVTRAQAGSSEGQCNQRSFLGPCTIWRLWTYILLRRETQYFYSFLFMQNFYHNII